MTNKQSCHSQLVIEKKREKSSNFWKDKQIWKSSVFNTTNCLIGCSIGDFSMIIYLQAYYPKTLIFWQIFLATLAGLLTSILLETIILRFKSKLDWAKSFTVAISMSFLSMVGMELAMNATDFMITGGKANFTSPIYWFALLLALIAGFIAPLPYNYYKLKKYKKSCH